MDVERARELAAELDLMISDTYAAEWLREQTDNPEKEKPVRDRFRVEAVPGHDGGKSRRQWRVRDDDSGVVIWPGGELGKANLMADKLNREKEAK